MSETPDIYRQMLQEALRQWADDPDAENGGIRLAAAVETILEIWERDLKDLNVAGQLRSSPKSET